MSYSLAQIAAADELPVDTDDMRAHLLTAEDSDDVLDQYQLAAVDHIELLTSYRMVEQTVMMVGNCFVPRYIKIPVFPVSDISISYDDPDGTEVIMPPEDYRVHSRLHPSYLECKTSWPRVESHLSAVRISVTCGHDDIDEIPASLVHAVKLLTGHFYEHRELGLVGATFTSTPKSVRALITPYKLYV